MGFNKVYRSLQEVFPQIDVRVLRAVAIEHRKDADAAVEAVLVEILPFFAEKSIPSTTSLAQSISEAESSDGAVATTHTMDSTFVNTVGSAGEQDTDYDDGQSSISGLASCGKILENNRTLKLDVESRGEDGDLVDKDGTNTDETISGSECSESSIESDNVHTQILSSPQAEEIGSDQNMNVIEQKLDGCHLEFEIPDGCNFTVGPCSLTVDAIRKKSLEGYLLAAIVDMHESDPEKLDKSLSNKTDTTCSTVGTEDESTLNASMSQSTQIHIMDALEETISDVRNNKKTMFTRMQSVISLMREVELKEQAAEQAKVEAAMGGANLLIKLEEFKQLVQRAEESNSMHAGEVYGEKAILTTELRELQSRVRALSDERVKSVTVLDEMRQTLEVRLAAAENVIKSAEKEKFEKEEAAMKAFADQELIMDKVVQESKILKQQAEENAKLQEFLLDRGRVVDMLQGEIAVMCEDVKLLKQSFDENVPFSKSLSSSQTSCILASSTSSSDNLVPENLAPDGGDSLVTQMKTTDAVSSSQEQSTARDCDKALMDDGWELLL